MKKALIVLLILAIAGGMFAQEASFSGGVETGIMIKAGDSNDPAIVIADNDDSDSPAKAKLNFKVEDDAWGLSVGSDATINHDGDAKLTVGHAYGWINFFDKFLVLSAGQIDGALWNVGGFVDTGYDDGLGIRLAVYPIPGLNLGVKFGYPVGTGWSASKIAYFFQETMFGFKFGTDLFNVKGSLKLYSEETKGDTDLDFILGAGTSVAGLSIDVGFGAYEVMNSDDIKMKFGLDLGYAIGDLGIALSVGAGINDVGEEDWVTETGFDYLKIVPSVSFPLGNITLGAEVKVAFGANGDGLGFAQFNPSATLGYTIGGATMTAGYGLNMITKDYGDTVDHTIKLIFGFAF